MQNKMFYVYKYLGENRNLWSSARNAAYMKNNGVSK